MFRLIITFLFLFHISAYLFSQVEYHSMEYEGTARDYIVFLPQNYNETGKMPVVFNLHGYLQSAYDYMNYTGMNFVADTAGFIVVYPSAINDIWNSGVSENPEFPTPDVDDVGFINALIDTLDTKFSIDLTRIYSCGLSNGGFMSFKLACKLSDRIAAIASVSGVISVNTAINCNVQHAVPVLYFHGTTDPIVPYEGTTGWTSAELTLQHWIELNSCSDPDTTFIPDSDPSDNCTVEKITYQECSLSNSIVFYKIIEGGHTWPDATQDYPYGNTNHDINAGNEIWQFFSNHELQIGNNVNQTKINNGRFLCQNYPNPFNNTTTFHWLQFQTDEVSLKVYNIFGQMLITLINERCSYGEHTIEWDGKDSYGNNVSSGAYLYQLKIGNHIQTKNLILIR